MDLPGEVPVMTLPSATLFPQALLPLYIFEPRYRQMLSDSLRSERMFSVAMQQPGKQREAPCHVAGLGLIRVSVGHEDGTSHLILQGLTRVELVETVRLKPYRVASIRPLVTAPADNVTIDALVGKIHELVEERMRVGPFPFPFSTLQNVAFGKKKQGKSIFSPKKVVQYLASLSNADQVADLVSCALLPGAADRQTILETVNLEDRLRHLVHFLIEEITRCRKESKS